MRGRFATTAILGRPPRLRVPDDGVGYLLRGATLYVDSYYASSSQTVPNLGTGGSTLDLTLGSTGTADSNDPQWLEYVAGDGAYVWLSGVASNSLSLADSVPLSVTGDISIRMKLAMGDWTAGSYLVSKRTSNAALSQGYELSTAVGGALILRWDDGTTVRTATSTSATGVTAGAAKWVRVDLDVDNGGQYDVKFYTSDNGTAWTQLGTTITGATGVTAIADSALPLYIGVRNATVAPLAGKVYRAVIYSDLTESTKVLDVDTSVITAAVTTTFTEQSSNAATVTINRSTAGLKTAVVHGATRGGSVWAFGTDDYMTTNGDQDGLDMAAGDSFTVAWIGREWATPVTGGVLIAKGDSTTGGSYRIRQATTTYGALGDITDASTPKSGASPVSGSSGAFVTYIMVVDRTAQTVTTYQNGIAGTPVDITATGDLSNAVALTIGRNGTGTAAYQDFTMQATVVDKGRAWNATQAAAVDAYFQNRTP